MSKPPQPLPGWPRGMRETLAAAYVGLSVGGLRAKVAAGEIAAAQHHSPGRIIYLRDHLDAYLDRLFGWVSGHDTEAEAAAEWDAACGFIKNTPAAGGRFATDHPRSLPSKRKRRL